MGVVKVGSDGVEQLLELVLGQRLGGVVRVQGSEKIVDLRPLAVRQRNAVRLSCGGIGSFQSEWENVAMDLRLTTESK